MVDSWLDAVFRSWISRKISRTALSSCTSRSLLLGANKRKSEKKDSESSPQLR